MRSASSGVPLNALRALGLLLLLLPVGCLAPRPPFEVMALHGRVHAETPEEARIVAEDLDRLAPRVRELLLRPHDIEPVVWVQSVPIRFLGFPMRESIGGFVPFPGRQRIHVRGGLVDPGVRAAVVAHELVHLLLPSRLRGALPRLVEEALCDLLTEQAVDSEFSRAKAWLQAYLAIGALRGEPPELVIALAPDPRDPASVRTVMGRFRIYTGEKAVRREPGLLSLALRHRGRSFEEPRDTAGQGLARLVLDRIVEQHRVAGLLECLEELAADPDRAAWAPRLLELAELSEADAEDLAAIALAGLAERSSGPTIDFMLHSLDGKRTWSELPPAPQSTSDENSSHPLWLLLVPARLTLFIEGTSVAIPVRDIPELARRITLPVQPSADSP